MNGMFILLLVYFVYTIYIVLFVTLLAILHSVFAIQYHTRILVG